MWSQTSVFSVSIPLLWQQGTYRGISQTARVKRVCINCWDSLKCHQSVSLETLSCTQITRKPLLTSGILFLSCRLFPLMTSFFVVCSISLVKKEMSWRFKQIRSVAFCVKTGVGGATLQWMVKRKAVIVNGRRAGSEPQAFKFEIVNENIYVLHFTDHVIYYYNRWFFFIGFSSFLVLSDCRSSQRRRQWLDRWQNGLCGGGLPSVIRGTTSE